MNYLIKLVGNVEKGGHANLNHLLIAPYQFKSACEL